MINKSMKSVQEFFPEISTNGEFALFKDAKVKKVNIFSKSKRLDICICSDTLIPASNIFGLENSLKGWLKLDLVTISPDFQAGMPAEEIVKKYWDSVLFYVNRKLALTRGIMTGSIGRILDGKLIVQLSSKGSEILKSQNCDRIIEDMLSGWFGLTVRVDFKDAATDEAAMEEYLTFKEFEQTKVVNVTLTTAATATPAAENGSKKQKPQNIGPGCIIHGKNFNEPLLSMSEVTQDSGRVAVWGDIFKVEFRELRSGKYICVFDATDYTSSLTLKLFVEKDDVDIYKEEIKEGVRIRARGEAQYDKFSKELTIFVSDMLQAQKEMKQDTAAEKRVELHLHTQMSSMDAITPAKELVKRAAQWGHRAVAITDHGVVQAFPDAFDSGKKNKIKIIYGVECYILDDNVPIVYNPSTSSLNHVFVVLDLETTGLNSDKDMITEIGAVKIKDGKIIDSFSSFVNPGIPIPAQITKLTGITNEMVSDAPEVEQVLLQFLEFINGAVLVAHNASFDMGFLKHFYRKMGEKIKNPAIDTLQLSRRMFPELGKYRLNVIASHLNVELLNHHRAVDDSRATGEIFIKCMEMLKEKGIKSIDEIESSLDGVEDYTKARSYHAIILVKNTVGLKNLYKIVSESHLKYYYKRPRVPKKLLMKYREGLILGSACEAGELYSAILDNKGDEVITKLARFYDYYEIQPLANNKFMINNGKVSGWEDLRNINKKIVRLGEKFKKPVVATCDIHFMDPEDEAFRRILMAGRGFSDADDQPPLYFRTTNEMLEEFSYLGEEKAFEVVVKNTNLIADMIEEIAPVPSGTFPPKIDGAEEEIEKLAMDQAREIYGDPLPEVVKTRLEKELNSIIKNGFAVMYLIAQKLVSKSLGDGYLVGSRGSVGSSMVANMAGITEVNSLEPHYICTECKYSEFINDGTYDCGFDLPDKDCPVCGKRLKKDGYDIPFETFLGFDGDKEPDIDLNFSGEYQPKAHKYTEELFGEGHVFRAGTIASVADKTAYGYVKNYLDERNRVVTNAEINRLVIGCTGVKRTTGQHPGGIMIVPQDKEIYDFSPIQRPADDTSSSIITTHFDYHFLHGSILKLDILGHDDPTVIRMLEDLTGVDATTIEIGEKNTMGIFGSTEPLGVKPEDINSDVGTFAIPEFGTKFVRQMLVDTKPKNFSELIRISGLSHGTDVWLNNAQDLIRNGTATLSQCICCRDDIMIYLIHKGLPPKTAFKIMEDVRKGKGVKEEYEQIMKENNVPSWYIQSCKTIKYMFPKAHAAAYVMMAFRIAWFKVNYPEAFYVTYFTVRADEFDAQLMTKGQDKVRMAIKEYEQKGNTMTQKEKNVLTILEVANEMYARGIKFLPVDLYKSHEHKFQIAPDGIRPPLAALQGLGASAAQNIVEARKGGEFLSIEELRIRSKISKAVIEILQQNGCLNGIPESNQLTLF